MSNCQILWVYDSADAPAIPHGPPAGAIRHVSSESVLTALGHADDCAAVILERAIDGSPVELLLESIRRSSPGLPVLIRDPRATLADAVRLGRLGADGLLPD